MKQKITGIIPAMVTPFNEKEEVDLARVRKVARFLKEEGADALYVTGSTGEAFVMSPEERMQVVEAVAEELNGEMPFMVHVGAISSKITKDLARHAQTYGAAAVASVPPFYWKFSEDAIVRYYEELADAVEIPTYIYNIGLAGMMSFETVCRLAKIPGIEGIKYTAHTMYEILRMREAFGPDFAIYFGCDEMAMSGFAYGADGAVGTYYNVMPDLFQELFHAYQARDLHQLQEKQYLANQVIMTALQYEMIPVVKLMMSWMGVDAGIARGPFIHYTQEQEKAIRQAFAALKDLPGADTVKFLREV